MRVATQNVAVHYCFSLSLLSLSAVYLAFKVEEYNVSVDQFVHVLAPQFRARTAEMVLRDEVISLSRLDVQRFASLM